MGCPIGNLALEVSDGNPDARRLIHENFENWARRVEGWLTAAGDTLPRDVNRSQLARFILTVMEGGLMQARAANGLKPYDDSVAVLRSHINLLLKQAEQQRPARSKAKRANGRKATSRKTHGGKDA
jgi:TetR/AcrR family transcriptional repressor of nem operon